MVEEAGVKCALVDAFTSTPFRGNPAAVCLLDTSSAGDFHSDAWMLSVAKEFNVSVTAFVSSHNSFPQQPDASPHIPRFSLRWFTHLTELDLCGHGTMAAAHFLFKSGRVSGDVVDFVTRSGLLTAKRIGAGCGDRIFAIELDLPVAEVKECDESEFPSIPLTLGGASIVAVKKISSGDLLVELSSGNDVANLVPHFEEIRKCAGRGVLVTGPVPQVSGFDFYSRFFSPKLGVDEDPVCGSAHCALAPYWGEKLGKCDLVAYMASPRSGKLVVHLEEKTQRVHIRGESVTVMLGTLLA